MEKLKAGKGLSGSEGAFTPLIKMFLEEALEGELEEHLSEKEKSPHKSSPFVPYSLLYF